MTVALMLLVFFGLLTAAFPRLWWSLSRWRYRNPDAVEPSDAAFAVVRIAGLFLGGVGLVLGVSGGNPEAAEHEREAEHRQAVAADPETVVRGYGDFVMREAKRSRLPPRRFGQFGLDRLAVQSRDIGSVRLSEWFTETGGVTVSVRAGLGTNFCLFLPETVGGRPTIGPGSCRPPINAQRNEVEALASRITSTAGAQGLSPRDETVGRQVTGPYKPGRFTVLRGTSLEVQFDPDFPYGDGDAWCILLPEQANGNPQVLQAACPSPPLVPTTSVPSQ